MLTCEGEGATPKQLLEVLTACDKHVNPLLFGRLFRLVARTVKNEWGITLRRRWVIRLPSHDEQVCSRVTKLCIEAIKQIRMPTGLRTWLMHSLVCVPTAGQKASMATAGSAFPKAMKWTAMVLSTMCRCAPQLNFAESGSTFRIPGDVDMEAVKTLVLQRVNGLSCLCDTV